jgi:glycerol-3-phosphate dehydrogenase
LTHIDDRRIYDLLVIGGGINGTGIARDAAGRGLSVALCEQGDLAQGTSSRSSKLVHGGLRYLEYGEFRLVRAALAERETLLRMAPHIVRPLRFVLPHAHEQRPAWIIRFGLLVYDHLGGPSRLPKAKSLDLRHAPEGEPLKQGIRLGFAYSDCWVDDARLVVLNALDAQARGAEVRLHTRVTSARRDSEFWTILTSAPDGTSGEMRARTLVNAAGPWVERVLREIAGLNTGHRIRPIKGSHIIVGKFWRGDHAYLLQNPDRRVIFVIPYQDRFALIGTTDVAVDGAPDEPTINDDERHYLVRALDPYMKRRLELADIVDTYSGVRPLFDDDATDPAAVTRDFVLDLDAGPDRAPILSIFGGKITTYRVLAEQSLAKLHPVLAPGAGPLGAGPWTAASTLPGGAMPGADFSSYRNELGRRFAWLTGSLADHYARLYGTRAETLLDGAKGTDSLGRWFGGQLYEREADFLRRTEWARTPEDILYRRAKHYLHLTPAERDAFAAWMARPA